MSDTSTINDAAVSQEDLADLAASVNADPGSGEVVEQEAPQSAGALVVQDAISRMQSGRVNVFSTVVGTDFDSKLKVLGAVKNALPIAEHTNEHIELENIVIQSVSLTQRDPEGNVVKDSHGNPVKVDVPRVILIDGETNTAYYGFSPVLLGAVETFLGVLGMPDTWPSLVGMKVTRGKARLGTFYDMVLDPRAEESPRKKR